MGALAGGQKFTPGLPGLLENCSKQEGQVYGAVTSYNTTQGVLAGGGMQPA